MPLLAVSIYCVVYSIISVGWVSNTFILSWSAAAGLLVGLIIAKIHRLPQPILHLAACLIGHWLSVWLTSVIAFHVSWGVLIAGIGAVLTDPTRLNNNSEMVFLFYLSFLSFFLAYFGAWLVYHAHLPWLVAIVYCSILLINLNYAKTDLTFLVAILVAALILLIARIQLTARLIQWKSEGLYTDRSWLRGITWRFMQSVSIMIVLTLLLGWILPVLSQPSGGVTFWNKLDNAWMNVTQGHLSLQNPGSILQAYQAPTAFFGDQLTIAGSVHLPTGEVLSYTSSAAPQYLAGFSYDHFDGHTWTSLASTGHNYVANAQLPNDSTANHTTISTSVTIDVPPEGTKYYLFGPAQPASFDVPTTLYEEPLVSGEPIVSAWSQRSALTSGERYDVTSFVPPTSPQDLSAMPVPLVNSDVLRADPNYSSLQALYLQLPSDLTPLVWHTTQQWTQGATSAYGALKMLESHLNNQAQFTYSLDNPPVPNNVDAVAWLLQTRQGYCTYYATAMTIMARQLGIPTRVVNGFSLGHLDSQRKVWAVDGSDAHSWVQAYFPGFGWINFDPTPGYSLPNANDPQPVKTPIATPSPARPKSTPTKPAPIGTPGSKNNITPPPSDPLSGGPTSPGALALQNFLMAFSIISLVGSILVLLVAIARYWWRNLYADSSFVAATFWRLCRLAGWVGLSPRTWQTPYEFSLMLSHRLPQEATHLWRLTELFVRERWAAPHQAPHAFEEQELQRLSPGLRRILLRLILMKTKRR
jgi:transglutaminase-like putative cysteine protease